MATVTGLEEVAGEALEKALPNHFQMRVRLLWWQQEGRMK